VSGREKVQEQGTEPIQPKHIEKNMQDSCVHKHIRQDRPGLDDEAGQ
jgi:hypothetical protein